MSYDPLYYSQRSEEAQQIEEMRSKSIIYKDYLSKKGLREEEN